MSYAAFLASKHRAQGHVGPDVDAGDLHPMLHPWQREATAWAIRKGRCAIWWDCGLGKSFAQVEWARLSADRALILAPLSVARQTVREARKIDVDVRYVRDGSQVDGPGVWITNYELADRFDWSVFGAVVADECFVAGTPVDTARGPRAIESVEVGGLVHNARGFGRVRAITTRRKSVLVRVYSEGRSFTCSEHHPWFTERGWTTAKDLRSGDRLIRQDEAVRVVRGDVYGSRPVAADALLRDVLLGEMEDAAARDHGASSCAGSRGQAWAGEVGVARCGFTRSAGGNRARALDESDRQSGGARQDLGDAQSDGSRAGGSWRERAGHNRAAASSAGSTRRGVGDRVRSENRKPRRLSTGLQAGPCAPGLEGRSRVRWVLAFLTSPLGHEEGRHVGVARVDRVEILQPGDPEFDRLSGGTDSVALYDLDVEGHPSFSVGGLLVHNSSILKNVDGKTRRMLTDRARAVPLRLACTATPAPNDVAELTNHAEWLGVMSRPEMLAAYFVNDEKLWRLKGHAAEPMFRWMGSWAHTLRSPADMGYPDDGYRLPELSIVSQVVDCELAAPDGQLFAADLGGVGGRMAIRRQTVGPRVELAAQLADDGHQWIVWCGLNDEAALAAKLIDGAVNVKGSWSPDAKAQALEAFQDNEIRVLVTKPAIAGLGMNFQNCSRMAFVGLSDSYESYYQAIRRCWRYGQTESVAAHIVVSGLESAIVENVRRKERQASRAISALIRHTHRQEIAA